MQTHQQVLLKSFSRAGLCRTMAGKYLLFGAILLACTGPYLTRAQELPKHAFTFKGLGVSYHLRPSDYPEVFANKFDDRGIWVANIGGIIGYDRFIKKNTISIRVQQGLYSDCAASAAGFTHLGFRAQLFRAGRHNLLGGIGPTLVYRQDWNRLPGYTDDGYFKRSGQVQYRFFWYAGELEYYYTIGHGHEAGITVIPGLPELFLVGLAYRKLF